MLNSAVVNYLSKSKGLPFFYVVGDKEYGTILSDLTEAGVAIKRLSDFCLQEDKYPDLDMMVDFFRTADVNYSSNKWVLVGLGEYLALRGRAEVDKILQKLKALTLGGAKVVMLLRCIATPVRTMLSQDLRLQSQNRVLFTDDTNTDIIPVCASVSLGLCEKFGIKYLIQLLEQGASGKICFDTALDLDNSLLSIEKIQNSYAVIKQKNPMLTLSETIGTEEFWSKLLKSLTDKKTTLVTFFKYLGLDDDFEDDFYSRAIGLDYKRWLYFISAKIFSSKIKNPYLRFVIENTNNLADFKIKVLTAICDVPHNDSRYAKLYSGRKKLVKGFPLTDIEFFVGKNAIDDKESIYRLTDNTLIEKQAIIDWISRNGLIDVAYENYPALKLYMKPYHFHCGPASKDLTNYFNEYKQIKLNNSIPHSFLENVSYYSKKYTSLDTRDNALLPYRKEKNVYLYWIDALGVEYLSYITEVAKAKGLSINIDVVRSELPTITPINKGFFDTWQGEKYKEPRLDDVKHEESGGYSFEKCKTPIHLASELEIIEDAIGRAASRLLLKESNKIIIVSDHGASRLAVINSQETKVPTDTKGEHSGRCCKEFSPCSLTNVVLEKGYFVLTDYSRFEGSRKANVEVHGGASLEEIVVPVITLSLKNSDGVEIMVNNPDNIYLDRKKGINIDLYISYTENKNNVRVLIDGKTYLASTQDRKHYTVAMPDIKRAKTYMGEVYDGDNLIGMITFTVKNKLGGDNADFDDLF